MPNALCVRRMPDADAGGWFFLTRNLEPVESLNYCLILYLQTMLYIMPTKRAKIS
jgi:hypothetical protein